jgi:magnesium-protoporphyrin IX monomethyl ester (oxidative) cyclase
MYVRDHARVEFHKALGLDPTAYDMQVFRVTTEITKQVFPLMLDLDNPAFRKGLDRLHGINVSLSAIKGSGLGARIRRAGLMAAASAVFARLMVLPAKGNEIPARSRLQPAW